MRAVRLQTTGGPEVLALEEVALLPPGPNEVRIRIQSIGVNFIDTVMRRGGFPLPLPSGLGLECAGEIDAVGDAVTGLNRGDIVVCGTGSPGAYAEFYNVEASRVVRLPGSISVDVAAASMMKGLTADYLLHRVAKAGPGMTIVVHAAAGGVGSILSQWGSSLGAKIIGIVGNLEKVAEAKGLGCQHVLVSTEPNFSKEVLEWTDGRGADFVLDSVGADVFEQSLECLALFGTYVSYGTASGPLPPTLGSALAPKSLWFTPTSVYTYTQDRDDLVAGANRLFEAIESRRIEVRIDKILPLAEVRVAHEAMEGRLTKGSIVLKP